MSNPPRVFSLIGCAAIGAVSAYLFATCPTESGTDRATRTTASALVPNSDVAYGAEPHPTRLFDPSDVRTPEWVRAGDQDEWGACQTADYAVHLASVEQGGECEVNARPVEEHAGHGWSEYESDEGRLPEVAYVDCETHVGDNDRVRDDRAVGPTVGPDSGAFAEDQFAYAETSRSDFVIPDPPDNGLLPSQQPVDLMQVPETEPVPEWEPQPPWGASADDLRNRVSTVDDIVAVDDFVAEETDSFVPEGIGHVGSEDANDADPDLGTESTLDGRETRQADVSMVRLVTEEGGTGISNEAPLATTSTAKAGTAKAGTAEAALDTRPLVVIRPGDSRPLLTLKIGRTDSRQMSPAEMRRTVPIAPALPAMRDELPQASLFLDVNEQDRTCAIRAQHVKLRTLLTTLGERSGVWITATQHVGGLVSTNISNLRIEEAIEEIAGPLGYSVGVRDDSILVGLHDEVRGYQRRLSDFERFDQARMAARHAEARRSQSLAQSRSVANTPTGPGRPTIALASYTEPSGPPNPNRSPSLRAGSRQEAARGASSARSGGGQSGATRHHPTSQGNDIPMHVGPPRPPSSEADLEARRAEIATDQDNMVSIIAERAMNLLKAGENRRAVNMLSQLVTEHQRSPQLFQLLGEAYYHCEQFEAAKFSLEHSLKLYKNDARTNYFLGCVLEETGDGPRSLHYLLQAHDIDPMYPPIVSPTATQPR